MLRLDICFNAKDLLVATNRASVSPSITNHAAKPTEGPRVPAELLGLLLAAKESK